MRGRHASFQSEAIDHDCALARRHGKIDKDRRGPFASKHFVKPNDPAVPRYELMPASFPGFLKDRVEQRVLELLGDDRTGHASVAASHAQPFEIAVMVSRHDETALWSSATRDFIEILQLDEAGKIFAREARTPEEIKHGPGEMLKRFAGDFAAVMARHFIAKRDLEIIQCDFVSMPIKYRHKRPQRLAEMEAGFVRQQRHKLHREPKSEPFKPVPDSFPSGMHPPL